MFRGEYNRKANAALDRILAMPTESNDPNLTTEQNARETERLIFFRDQARLNLHIFDLFVSDDVVEVTK